jgi:hypothetical protein
VGLVDKWRALDSALHPEWVIQVQAVKKRLLGSIRVDFLIFTGEESIWQGPGHDRLDLVVPRGHTVEPGTALVAQRVQNGWRILWDRPEPALPPMQFPSVRGGDDPEVMIEHMRYLVGTGALTQEAFDRGVAYLRGGWPSPA